MTIDHTYSEDWWRSAVVYQIYIRSFCDRNGDGIGDIAGIRSKLHYLVELGVDAIWISPWYESPMKDGGYDVADYRKVDPRFGTNEEATRLIDEAHELGLRVVLDIVPNHTSNRHPWFLVASASTPGSPSRQKYVIRTGRGPAGQEPPTDWKAAFGGSAWQRLDDGEWYLHSFSPDQPDLNWLNSDVRSEFEDILRFWLSKGVDGFRIDVANCLVKPIISGDKGKGDALSSATVIDDPPSQFDEKETHDVYRAWRRVLDSYSPPRMAIGEVWLPSPADTAKYRRADELQQTFELQMATTHWDAHNIRRIISDSLAASDVVASSSTWVLSNHDVAREVTRFGTGSVGVARARAALLLILALPGAVYLYQGEELGLPQVTDLPDSVIADPVWTLSRGTDRGRDGCRIPMPWDRSSPSFGFSSALAWLPQPPNWKDLSVSTQLGANDSTLNLYRTALSLRRQMPEFLSGAFEWIEAPEDVLAFTRRGDSETTCMVNLGSEAVAMPKGTLVLSSEALTSHTDLPPSTAAWWVS